MKSLAMTKLLVLMIPAMMFCADSRAETTRYKITFYDACIKCCGKTDGITASGKLATPHHTVACNGLPFGTKLRIDGVIYTVEDRGARSLFGTRKNPIHHIDIFCSSHAEAKRGGVRFLPVEILK